MIGRRSGKACALLLCFVSALVTAREKSDVIVIRNGDRLSGQILVMQYGQLSLKTDYLGTADIEWTDIARIESPQQFIVQDLEGIHHSGALLGSEHSGQLVVSNEEGRRTELRFDEIDRMYAGEPDFLSRLTGSFSIGFDYTKANDISTLSGSFDTVYRAPSFLWSFSADLNRTEDPDEGALDRDALSYTYQWLRRDRRFIVGLSSLERHEELGIEARLQLGAGLGKYFVQTSKSELAGILGVALTREWATGVEHAQESVEAVLAANWRIYQFTTPKTNLTSAVAVYPNLTDPGRYRSTLDVTLRRELASDLYLDLSVYSSYDNDPPDENASHEDYGITTSLGYSFY